MEIRHLECFLTVARCGNFTKAAEQIHISQPSISKMIKEIEAQMGIELFYRDTKHVELTDAGIAFLEHAQQIVALFDNLTTNIDGLLAEKSGKIRIGFPPITSVTMFSQVLGVFKKEHPNIELQLFEFGSKTIEKAIQDGELDIGIVSAPATNKELYEMFWLTRDSLEVVMHPEHALAAKSTVAISDLAKESFVLYSRDFRLHDQIIERCRIEGFDPKIMFETSQLEFMIQIVAANVGIVLLPTRICRKLDSSQVVSRPLAGRPIYLQLGVIWKKGRYLPHAARQWIEFARTVSWFKDMDIDIVAPKE